MKNSLLIVSISLIIACTGNNQDPVYTPTAYPLEIPVGFPEMNIPADNPMTIEGVELGRKLYYDTKLHSNGEKACASCHVQENSFSSDKAVLPAVNLGWSRTFLWDGSVQGELEDIMHHEVTNFFQTDVSVLQGDPEYPELFKKAFGSDQITEHEIVLALAQFFRTMNSGNSKFDKVLRGEAQFTNEEFLGYELFFTERGDCFHCHATVFMTDNSMHNNALDANPDPGYFNVTGDSLDFGKFKSPTLRNLVYTAPYMHDGRYSTLEEVIEFYSQELQKSPTVDPLMKNLSKGGIQLTTEEKAGLVAFLKTLSDSEFTTNPALSEPQR